MRVLKWQGPGKAIARLVQIHARTSIWSVGVRLVLLFLVLVVIIVRLIGSVRVLLSILFVGIVLVLLFLVLEPMLALQTLIV